MIAPDPARLSALDAATRVTNEVARHRHRPVVVQVDGVEGMERFVAIHNGSASTHGTTPPRTSP